MKVQTGKYSLPVIRGITFFLCLLCLQKAWISFELYRAEERFARKDFSGAVRLLSLASAWDPNHPGINYLLGKSTWLKGVSTGDPAWFRKSEEAFRKFREEVPDSGRGMVYQALCLKVLERQSPEGMTPVVWGRIKTLLEEAYRRESGSPWMAYMVGKNLLTESQFLTLEEKHRALDMIRQSLASRYPGQISLYLKPALPFIWNRFHDPNLLRSITPPDNLSYYQLIQFLDQNGLWAYRQEPYALFRVLNQKTYLRQCEAATESFRRGDYERARNEFQQAVWTDSVFQRARLGVIVSRLAMGEFPEIDEKQLQNFLEEEEEFLGDLIADLEPLVHRTNQPYLEGLWAYRMNHDDFAISLFEKAAQISSHKFLRRYLANAYRRFGQRDRAEDMLRPALDEPSPDLRELFLLKEWNTADKEKINKKIDDVATRKVSADDWVGPDLTAENRLEDGGYAGTAVQLKPGRATLKISAKSKPDARGQHGYILLRLYDGDREYFVGSAYVYHRGFKEYSFELNTAGGARWVLVNLMNGGEAGGSEPLLPSVELGEMTVEHQT